jgi:CD2 antigen cytoplasmic tail-binding protein 2
LRRLKGTSNNRKEKMSAETKLVFDQLTEDAMKLMENGELGRVCYFNGLTFSCF